MDERSSKRRAELDLDGTTERLLAALTELEGEVRRRVAQLEMSRTSDTSRR